jgi:hypothetical protein
MMIEHVKFEQWLGDIEGKFKNKQRGLAKFNAEKPFIAATTLALSARLDGDHRIEAPT